MTKKARSRARSKPSPVISGEGEGPTLERIAKAGEAVEQFTTDTGRRATRLNDGDILGYLASRNVITTEQHSCGERYYRDWYEAGFAASGVIDPGRVVVDGGNADPAIVHRMEKAQDWVLAAKAVGPVHAHPLTDMVLLEMPATTYAMRYMGQRDPKDARLVAYAVLKTALDALVLHYLGARHTRTRYHREPDAVPVMEFRKAS